MKRRLKEGRERTRTVKAQIVSSVAAVVDDYDSEISFLVNLMFEKMVVMFVTGKDVIFGRDRYENE